MAWRVILSGTGPLPSIVTEADTVVTPPAPPPPPPPPPPPEDTSPFIWPQQPVRPDDAAARYAGLGGGFYAGQQFQNPAPGSAWWAGTIVAGRAGSWDLAGYDLWAPRDADPAAIRRALATGRP